MIKANELRIGNAVLYGKSKELQFITESDFTHIVDCPELYKPVSLTARMVKKIGFKSVIDTWYELDLFEGSRKLSISIIENGWAIGDDDYAREVVFKGVPYLHQLQNLFYCICGEELKITL